MTSPSLTTDRGAGSRVRWRGRFATPATQTNESSAGWSAKSEAERSDSAPFRLTWGLSFCSLSTVPCI